MVRKQNIPAGWVQSTLGEICAEKVEQRAPKSHSLPYVDISSIDRQAKSVGDVREVTPSDAPIRARQRVESGDVLVSMTRPNLNAVAIIGSELDGAIASTGFDVLRAVQVLPMWIYYRVLSNEFISDVCSGLQGVVYPAIRPRDVRRHGLPLPPLPEQARIIEAIDSYVSRLDAAVANLERVQQNLKLYRASVLKSAVEGRLVPTEAELDRQEGLGYEPASVLLERILAERRRRWIDSAAETGRGKVEAKARKAGKRWSERDKSQALEKERGKVTKKYKEPLSLDTDGLRALPEGWCWGTIEMVADVGTGATPKRGESRYWSNGTVPWISSAKANSEVVSDPSEFVTEEALNDTNLFLYPPGSIVLAMYGEGKTRGRSAVLSISTTTNQALAAIVTRETAVSLRPWISLFLRYNYENIRRAAAGGVQPNLNLKIVKRIAIPIPPLSEQVRIANRVDYELSNIENLQTQLDEQGPQLDRLRQTILKWAFEGKLVDQDPNDEPVAALLERIKAEREPQTKRSHRKPTSRRKAK